MTWINQPASPCCGQAGDRVGNVRLKSHLFGKNVIVQPKGGVGIRECAICGAIYKDIVPSPSLLKSLTESIEDDLWVNSYEYRDEADLIRKIEREPKSILDIGAAGGDWLLACGVSGRRSALDITHFNRLTLSSEGEFIQGFLDDSQLAWGEKPYDIVTAFDIFEHLYNPNQAMENCRILTRINGFLVIETGDASSLPKNTLGDWYYLNLFEHHIAWSPKSIIDLAKKHGFEMVSMEKKKHKLVKSTPPSLRSSLIYNLYKHFPLIYILLRKSMSRHGNVPAKPNAIDHMRIVFRRIS